MNKAVFLDRDGVINKTLVFDGIPRPPKNLKELVILPGTSKAIKLLREVNFEIVVVTNQPDVARGLIIEESVKEINDYLGNELKIDYFYCCFHDDSAQCNCRKPKPGLLVTAAQDLELDLKSSFMVGDRWRDISAGQAAGCDCFFIDYGYSEKSPILPFRRVSSLLEASKLILETSND
jgi:D-glycero-D-manno-heptose 1,7-bisphosphate phosphatase